MYLKATATNHGASFSSYHFFTFSILTYYHHSILHVSYIFRDNDANIDYKLDFELKENYEYPNYFSELTKLVG